MGRRNISRDERTENFSVGGGVPWSIAWFLAIDPQTLAHFFGEQDAPKGTNGAAVADPVRGRLRLAVLSHRSMGCDDATKTFSHRGVEVTALSRAGQVLAIIGWPWILAARATR